MILKTDRLILGPWQSADWTSFRPIAVDPDVMRHITGGAPWTDEQIRGFVDRNMKLYSERGFCRWKLLEASTGETIGFCGVGFWRDAVDPEIGWWLARRHWGRGLASEAARCSLRDAFERVQLPRIMSVAARANTASIRVMQKLGLKFDTEFENEGLALVRYVIDRADYVAASAKI
jgi:RimJ/RimL family protein N-acetyltransferase